MKAVVGLVSPDAIDDEDDEGKPDDEPYDHELQRKCPIYLLPACAREGLKEAIEQGIGEDVAQAVPTGFQYRQGDSGITFEMLVFLLPDAQCPGDAVQDIRPIPIQANDEQYKCPQTYEEGNATHMHFPSQPYQQGGQEPDGKSRS